ncbi:MAG: hypothetical protein ACC628_10440 [Pirellulaceae bacterium]
MRASIWTTIGLHLLFFVSGATGLICEVVWTRWLTGVFGSASTATAIVLAAFMGGLGTGSWLSARLADRVKQPVRLYALIELGVAALVLLPFWESRFMGPLFAGLAGWVGPSSTWLHVMRVGTAILALGPPSVLMGLSLPVVVRAVTRSRRVLGRSMASAYAANSLGGVMGTVLAGFVLVETFGLIGTALIAGGLAIAVAAAAFWLSRWSRAIAPSGSTDGRGNKPWVNGRAGKASGTRDESQQVVAPRAAGIWILAAAAVAGFCALGYETIWSRVLSVLTLNTTYAFSLMLATLLLGLSLGSWLVCGRLDRLRDPAAWFAGLQILLAAYALSSMLWSTSIVDAADYFVSGGDGALVVPWFGRPLVMALCLLLVPSVLMGASLPVACKIYATATGGIARPVGLAYAANTFGSVVGALLVGLVVIPSFGSWWATTFCAVLGTIAAAGMSWFYTAPNHRTVFTAGSGAAAVIAVTLGLLHGNTFVIGRGLDPDDRIVFGSEDEYGLTEVVEDQRLGTRRMLTNRLHREGSTLPRAVAEQRKQGLLPLVLHSSPRRVLEIGVGTGIKLSALTIPAVEEAVAVEISPGVIEASQWFADYNHKVTVGESKLEIVCADGRNFVAVTSRKFDVIVNGLLTPYRAGVSRLYTVEHFRSCRAKLADDGIFVVWVAIRQIAPDDLKVLSRSLLEVFPHTTLWLDGYYAALVSTKTPAVIDADRIQQRCAEPALARALGEAGVDGPSSLLASFVAGPETLANFAGDQPLNTEDRPIIEFRTPRLGGRLNTSDLAAETIGTFSLLQEPMVPKYVTGSQNHCAAILQAQRARWMARQALIQKCYGNHVEAAKMFHEALALDRGDDLARYELETYLVSHGKQCVNRGLWDQAHEVFRQAVAINPRSVGALASLAALEERAGNRNNAERMWQRVLALDPRNHQLRLRVADSSSNGPTQRY